MYSAPLQPSWSPWTTRPLRRPSRWAGVFLVGEFPKCSMGLEFTYTKPGQMFHISCAYGYIYIYLEPKWPGCFDWKWPCFGGLTFKNRGQLGSRYIDHKFMINVGIYSSPMEHMGLALNGIRRCHRHPRPPAEVWYDWTPQNIPIKHQTSGGMTGCLGMYHFLIWKIWKALLQSIVRSLPNVISYIPKKIQVSLPIE